MGQESKVAQLVTSGKSKPFTAHIFPHELQFILFFLQQNTVREEIFCCAQGDKLLAVDLNSASLDFVNCFNQLNELCREGSWTPEWWSVVGAECRSDLENLRIWSITSFGWNLLRAQGLSWRSVVVQAKGDKEMWLSCLSVWLSARGMCFLLWDTEICAVLQYPVQKRESNAAVLPFRSI